jgi:1-acyl-sn-glycerol-3-phosphate acyltransferase
MLERAARGWRYLAIALATLIFFGGAVLLSLLLVPALLLPPRRRVLLGRAVIRQCFRGFIFAIQCFGLMRYRIKGLERLERHGLLILANHPTLIDVVFLIALVRNADCVVKSSLAKNPFTFVPMRVAGYLTNASGAEVISACVESLRQGNNLIMFPEGTRTPQNKPVRLQRGAAYVAIEAPRDITPVVISCTPLALGKEQSWWKVADERLQFALEVRDDIAIAPFLAHAADEGPLRARRLTEHLSDYFFAGKRPHAGA